MKFTLDIEGIDCKLHIIPNPNFLPTLRIGEEDQTEMNQEIDDNFTYFQIIVNSYCNNQSFTHYLDGIPLPKNETELQEELEIALESEGVIDFIVDFWNSLEIQSDQFPPWSK